MLWFHKRLILKAKALNFLIWLPWRPSSVICRGNTAYSFNFQLHLHYSNSTYKLHNGEVQHSIVRALQYIPESYVLKVTGWRTKQSSYVPQISFTASKECAAAVWPLWRKVQSGVLTPALKTASNLEYHKPLEHIYGSFKRPPSTGCTVYIVTLPRCFTQQREGQRVMDRGERSRWLALLPVWSCFVRTWPAGSCRQRPPERSRDTVSD